LSNGLSPVEAAGADAFDFPPNLDDLPLSSVVGSYFDPNRLKRFSPLLIGYL